VLPVERLGALRSGVFTNDYLRKPREDGVGGVDYFMHLNPVCRQIRIRKFARPLARGKLCAVGLR